jgi:hypothetical protein
MNMNKALQSLADHVKDDPFFLALPLRLYAESEQLDDAGLATALRCRPEDLVMIRLCRSPRAEPGGFREDVTRVAERFGVEPQTLAEVIRRGQAIHQARARETPAGGSLLAARDREAEEPSEDS